MMDIFTNENQKKHFAGALITVAFLLAAFLGIRAIDAVKEYRYIGRGAYQPNVIAVTGTGEVTAVPDTGSFSFSVIENAATSAAVTDMASKKMNAIIAAV